MPSIVERCRTAACLWRLRFAFIVERLEHLTAFLALVGLLLHVAEVDGDCCSALLEYTGFFLLCILVHRGARRLDGCLLTCSKRRGACVPTRPTTEVAEAFP